MNIKIKNVRKLRDVAKQFRTTPRAIVNDFVEAFHSPPRFEDAVRKSSFVTALNRVLSNSDVAETLLYWVS